MMKWRVAAFLAASGFLMTAKGQAPPQNPVGHGPEVVAAGRVAFNRTCTACHGVDGNEGERAPALVGDRRFFRLSERALYDTIKNGIPGTAMMAMGTAMDDKDVWRIVVFIRAMRGSASETDVAGNVEHGQEIFAGKGGCAKCHAIRGKGGTIGPDMSNVGAEMTLKHLREALTTETPMTRGYRPVSVVLANGQTLKGVAKNEDAFSLQLLDYDNHLHLIDKADVRQEDEGTKSLMPHDYDKQLSKDEFQDLLAMLAKQTRDGGRKKIEGDGGGGTLRAIILAALMTSLTAGAQVSDKLLEQPPGQDWLHYNGDYQSKRYSTLDQITTENVGSVVNKWTFHVPGQGGLESVPVVVNGVMYLTQPNAIYALDGKSGRLIWSYHHQLAKIKDREGPHRGAAVYKDRVYFTTTDDFLYALDAASGNVLWQVKIAETDEGYSSPAAPLIAKGKVIVGISPGDRGLNGFLDAYDAETGKRLWRYDPIPHPGEPGSESWAGDSWKYAGGDTWLTGSYDPELNLLYWGIGNPSPDFNGDVRAGDNLYTECVVALDLDTGKMKWYFQFTPHDTMDWDAVEIPILVDAPFNGQPRKLLVQADRNGFYYVLDRVTGEFLHGSQFERSQNWASGLDEKGRPKRLPGKDPTLTGVKICPSSIGATNWMSPTYDPDTGWFYFVALEGCGMATMNTETFRPGGYQYRAGGDVLLKDDTWQVSVRALELTTGKQMWETPRVGSTNLGGGLVSTKGGVIFSGESPGQFVALDPKTGKMLWHYNTGQEINAQPITYMVDGKQFVAIESNSDVFGFALFEPEKPAK